MKDKLTIVGPEPSGGREGSASSWAAIDALLLMAKYDETFRALLLNDREAAMAQSGIRFIPTEKLLLKNILADSLASSLKHFSINGISRESRPSWRDAAAVFILIMTVFIGGACRSGYPPGHDTWEMGKGTGCGEFHQADIDAFDYGWCDEDTFRIKAAGPPAAKETAKEKRKETACKTAVLMAQYQALNKFQGARIESGVLMPDGWAEKYAQAQDKFKAEAKVFVTTGTILAAKWDDTLNCTVVYQLQKPGLKKWVLGYD